MEPERINSTALRTKTRDLMERVKYNGDRFVVETFGRPMAVIISIQDFELIQHILKQAGMTMRGQTIAELPDKAASRKKTRVKVEGEAR